MSGQDGSVPHLTEDKELPPAEAQIARSKKPEESDSIKERWEVKEEEEEEEEEVVVVVVEDNSKEEESEEEEMATSAHLEPNTLPWPEDKDKRLQTDNDDGVWSEKRVSDPEDGGTELHGGSRGLSEERSQAGNDGKSKWRESMPEGDRWRDDEIELQRNNIGGGSLADDEDEGEEEEDDKLSTWISEKASLGFTPKVTIVHPSSKELPEESRLFIEDVERKPQTELNSAAQLYPEWIEPDDKYYLCEPLCGSKLMIALATAAAGLLFPLLLWGGYALLPFDPPQLVGTPLRVVYTLRCAFFGIIPIVLGVVVQGVARLRYSALQPLYQGKLVNREVTVHWHYVNESLALFLFYFLQLAVMATYISQDLLKLVPLLTIIFVFGRLIYWLCLSLDSSIRGLGFGFSFFPILVMLGTNLYFICSSVGHGAVFNVEPPTTAPPPKLRWWG